MVAQFLRSRITGWFLLLIGVVLMGLSYYINHQVAEGRIKIASAERSVQSGKTLFGITPLAPLGEEMTRSAERKIAAGKEEADWYAEQARFMQIVGIVCVVLGVGILIFGKRGK